MNDPMDMDALYDKSYYDERFGPTPYDRADAVWLNHFRTMATRIVADFAPKRVLDVGCAKGFLVEHLRDLGVEARGIDGSSYAVSQAREDMKAYCTVASALEPFGEHYDLITCIEVAEHLPESDAEKLVANLCAHTDEILFSSTPEDFAEPTHFNVRQREYWENLFALQGFFPNARFDGSYVTQQAIHFRRVSRPIRAVVFSKEKAEWAVVRLRVLDPLRELERQGKAELTFVSSYDEAIDVERLLGADLFIIGREFADRAYSADVIEAARAVGIPIVFELDDLLWKVPRSNPVWPYCVRIAPDMMGMVRDADYVTASTGALKDELAEIDPSAPSRTHVLRNCINTEIWGEDFVSRRPAGGEPLVFGWFGSPTHQEDLQIVQEAIRYLAAKYQGRVEFHFFGYMPRGLKGTPGVRYVRGPQANVVKHARGVREASLHAAIAPLTDHPFNHSKSDLKWLEYSICGLPGIYSDITPYRTSVSHGYTGLLAKNTTASWVEAIETFIRDADLRDRIAANAFEEVRGNYCLDVAAWRWDRLYRSFVAGGPRTCPGALGDAEVARAAALLCLFQGQQQARRGLLGPAEQSFASALELDPALSPRILRATQVLLKDGRIAAAERLLVAAAGRDPKAPENFRALASFYRGFKDPVNEEYVLQAAANEHPDDADVAQAHVELLAGSGRAGAATDRLRTALMGDDGVERGVQLVETLVASGKPGAALEVVTAAAGLRPDQDWSPLTQSLQVLCGRTDGAASKRLEIVVCSALAPTTTRMQRRIVGPLTAIERLHGATTRFTDGSAGRDAIASAGLVVMHQSLLPEDAGLSILEECRERGIPVVVDVDVPWRLDESSIERLRTADAVTVANDAARDALLEVAADAAERIHVLPTHLDLEAWGGGRAFVEDPKRPFEIGLFTAYVNPSELTALIRSLGPVLRDAAGGVALSIWDTECEPGGAPQTGRNVACSSPYLREYARGLKKRGPDLAIVPISEDARFATASDALFLELAACRVPVLCSGRAPLFGELGLVEAERTGFVSHGGHASLAEPVRRLILGRELRRGVAERAWTKVVATRTVQAHAGAWWALYGELTAGAARLEPALS